MSFNPESQTQGEGHLALPHICGEWPKGKDTVRISLTEYNKRRCIDCRIWYTDAAGELKPSSKGLTLTVVALPQLASAINAALEVARANGLIDEGDAP